MAALIAFFLGFVSSDRWSVSLSAVCLDPSRLASVTVSVTRRTSKVVKVVDVNFIVVEFSLLAGLTLSNCQLVVCEWKKEPDEPSMRVHPRTSNLVRWVDSVTVGSCVA